MTLTSDAVMRAATTTTCPTVRVACLAIGLLLPTATRASAVSSVSAAQGSALGGQRIAITGAPGDRTIIAESTHRHVVVGPHDALSAAPGRRPCPCAHWAGEGFNTDAHDGANLVHIGSDVRCAPTRGARLLLRARARAPRLTHPARRPPAGGRAT